MKISLCTLPCLSYVLIKITRYCNELGWCLLSCKIMVLEQNSRAFVTS